MKYVLRSVFNWLVGIISTAALLGLILLISALIANISVIVAALFIVLSLVRWLKDAAEILEDVKVEQIRLSVEYDLLKLKAENKR